MSGKSNIEWTSVTWNPIRGCSRTSPGCSNCYAERQAIRQAGPGRAYEGLVQIANGHPQWTGKVRLIKETLSEPLLWRKSRGMVFVNSMSDLFHESLTDEDIAQVFAVMAVTRLHTYQALTKRAVRMHSLLNSKKFEELVRILAEDINAPWMSLHNSKALGGWEFQWPLPNVWLGVSIEDAKRARERLPLLLRTPAAVIWVSLEPLLDYPDMFEMDLDDTDHGGDILSNPLRTEPHLQRRRIDWMVVGGESGPGARPFDIAWARRILAEAKAADVPVFMKQLGSVPMMSHESWQALTRKPLLAARNKDRVPEDFVPLATIDSKGGDMNGWPEDLRVRQWPAIVGRSGERTEVRA